MYKKLVLGVFLGAMTSVSLFASVEDEKGIYNENYTMVIPPKGHNTTGKQKKSNSNYRGVVNVSNVGSNYRVSAIMANYGTYYVNGLGDHSQSVLPNNAPKGAYVKMMMKLTSSTYVDVETYGTWRSN